MNVDYSDLVGVFFLTGSIGHSVLLSQYQTNANLSPLSVGETRKGGTRAGCRPFAFLHLGTICLEVRIRSAALIFLARHKTAILGATLLAGVVRQLRGTGRQPVHSRIVAVGWQVPTCGAGVDRSSSRVGEVSAHPPPGSPRYARSRRYSVVERINSSHIPRTFG